MAFPQQVLDDIITAKQYYSDLNAAFIVDLKRGCDNCTPKQGNCLMGLLTSLEFKSTGDYDEESQGLYQQMMEVIGGEAYVPPVVSNTTYTGTGTPTTQDQILAGLATAYTEETGLIAQFNNSGYLINFLAIPITAPIPTQYVNMSNPFDTGMIGSPSDLFGAFTIIGDFRVAVTNYPIPLTDTYLFS